MTNADRSQTQSPQPEVCRRCRRSHGFHKLDLGFHEILLDSLGFPKVKAAAESARLGLDRVRRLLASPERHARTRAEHERIVDAL